MNALTQTAHQLVYLIYGDAIAYHDEARFSLLSARYRAADPDAFRLRVITDQPQHYSGLPVEVVPLTAAQLTDWFGPQRYQHRAKLCALRAIAPRAAKTVFVDTDTFFLKDPMALFAAIDDGHGLVDEYYEAELAYDWCRDPTVAAQLAAQGLAAGPQAFINSGLFGFAGDQADLFERALALCDVMYPASNRYFAIEQLALGLAASRRMRLRADDAVIKHYWSRKTLFRAKAQAFWRQYGQDWNSPTARAAFLQVNERIPKPPLPARLCAKALLLSVPSAERRFLLEWYYGSYDYANPFDRAARAAWREKAQDNLQARHPEVNAKAALQRRVSHWLGLQGPLG